jgi:hypothetical protein
MKEGTPKIYHGDPYADRLVERMTGKPVTDRFSFEARVEIFQREKGWHYVPVPPELSKPLEPLADRGLIAITAQVGTQTWPTSLLPMGDGTHFIALPAKVRAKQKIGVGGVISVVFGIRSR